MQTLTQGFQGDYKYISHSPKIYKFPSPSTSQQDTTTTNEDLQKLNGNITQHFLDQCTKETARTYKTAILEFFQVKYTAEITLSDIKNISYSQIEKWLKRNKSNFRMVKGVKEYTKVSTMTKKCTAMASLIQYINHLLMFADSAELKNPFKDSYLVGKIKKQFVETVDKEINVFTEDEIKKLFDIIETSGKETAYRDYIMFKVLFNCGLRREELINITFQDIVEIDGEYALNVTKAKGNKQRQIYLSSEIASLLHTLMDDSKGTNEIIFNMTGDNVYKILNSYCKMADIEKERIYPHLARHSFSSIADERGCALRDIQETLGHESPSTTSKYIHRTNKFKQSASRMVGL